MKNKKLIKSATKLLFILLSITFVITVFCLISLLTKKSEKEGFDAFTSFFTETLPGAADDIGDAALKPVLDLLRSIKSGFESANDGVNNLENDVLSVGERIDSIIRKKTFEITGEEITKGESLKRSNNGINNISSSINKINNMIKEASEKARQESERNAKESQQRAEEAAQQAAKVAQQAAEAAQRAREEEERVKEKIQQSLAKVTEKFRMGLGFR
jgi:methyl-accepting chemotaxis protein